MFTAGTQWNTLTTHRKPARRAGSPRHRAGPAALPTASVASTTTTEAEMAEMMDDARASTPEAQTPHAPEHPELPVDEDWRVFWLEDPPTPELAEVEVAIVSACNPEAQPLTNRRSAVSALRTPARNPRTTL